MVSEQAHRSCGHCWRQIPHRRLRRCARHHGLRVSSGASCASTLSSCGPSATATTPRRRACCTSIGSCKAARILPTSRRRSCYSIGRPRPQRCAMPGSARRLVAVSPRPGSASIRALSCPRWIGAFLVRSSSSAGALTSTRHKNFDACSTPPESFPLHAHHFARSRCTRCSCSPTAPACGWAR